MALDLRNLLAQGGMPRSPNININVGAPGLQQKRMPQRGALQPWAGGQKPDLTSLLESTRLPSPLQRRTPASGRDQPPPSYDIERPLRPYNIQRPLRPYDIPKPGGPVPYTTRRPLGGL